MMLWIAELENSPLLACNCSTKFTRLEYKALYPLLDTKVNVELKLSKNTAMH